MYLSFITPTEKNLHPRIWAFFIAAFSLFASGDDAMSRDRQEILIRLPAAVHHGTVSLEQALVQRRSVRRFDDEPLPLAKAAQLLWAAQGITHAGGFRTAPSAGALYPLKAYLIAGKVTGLDAGVYLYDPRSHSLVRKAPGEKRRELSRAALGQSSVSCAPAVILLTAISNRATGKYGQRGVQYVHMEAGHAAQNIALQAISLNLGAVFIGAFQDDLVQQVIGLGEEETPLYLIPVGRQGVL